MEKKEWFASWFDTTYYHTLYRSRDEREAEEFIKKLVNFLEIAPGTPVLDLACGKGRHAKTLADLGLVVTGVDLSANSIQEAQKFVCENLSFAVHDMREVYPSSFDIVFNLFTSFGYFSDQKENERVIRSVHQMLNDNGLLIIDFMNAQKVIKGLVEHEVKSIDDIEFKITRKFTGEHIVKEISFTDHGKDYHFEERVQALGIEDFKKILEMNGFQILHIFGSYELQPFEVEKSDRLLLISKKIK